MKVFHMTRCVHSLGDQGGQPEMSDGRGVVPEVPGKLVSVVRVARDEARRGIPPQPHRHGDRAEQEVQGGQREFAPLIPRSDRIIVREGGTDKAKAGCRKFCNLYERILRAKVRLSHSRQAAGSRRSGLITLVYRRNCGCYQRRYGYERISQGTSSYSKRNKH
jgi:hypothetical protein